MPVLTELELPLFKADRADPNVERLLRLLAAYGHLTRAQIGRITGWKDRDIRALAEAAGAEVVRGQNGFCLTSGADLDEILEAARIAISQGKKMIRYGLALKRRVHAKVG